MKNIVVLLAAFLIGFVVYGQSNLQLKVISGGKLLFKEEGKLEQIFREHYGLKKRELQDRIKEAAREHMKIRSTQSLRDENVTLGYSPYFSVYQVDAKAIVAVTIPNNTVSFRVTTPDVLGIGKDRSEDPSISVTFTVKGLFEISQNGNAEAIEFNKPHWSYEIQETKFQKLENLEVGEVIKGDMPGMTWRFKEVFNLLGEVKDKFNYYINEEIVENKMLQQEFQVDGNDKLLVSTEGENSLLFKHEYSSAGILKRNVSTDASGINENVQTIPTVPTSTKPGDMNQKPHSSNQPSKLPNSTKPGDANKGASSVPKTSPVIKKYQ